MNSDTITIHSLEQIDSALLNASGEVVEILESARVGDIDPQDAAKLLAETLETLQSVIAENFKMP